MHQVGTIEYQERQRLLNLSETQSQVSMASTRAPTTHFQAPLPPMRNHDAETLEVMEFTEGADEARRVHEEHEKKLQLQRQIRQIRLPTAETEVKSQLRQMGQPITYFGESAADRRERLRKMLAEFITNNGRLPNFEIKVNVAHRDMENQHFMYEGKEQLKEWRLKIAKSSLRQAAIRVEKARLRRLLVDALEEDREVENECREASKFEIVMAQFADPSCVSRGCISPNQQLFASAGGTGEAKVWRIDDTSLQTSLLGHLTKTHSIAFHPQSTLSLPPTSFANIATGSSDLSIRLWTLDLELDPSSEHGTLQRSVVFKGHEDRINKVLYHQLGTLLISMSHDKTWRLWDLERQEEILCQTGHSKAVYAGALHPDGSLLFSGDLGGTGMIWDLRTGKGILPIVGHVKGIISADFSPNGYHLATGGDDNHVRIWDIRRRGPLEKIPAHTKLVSDVQFQPKHGRWLVSSSYDGSIKVWNSRDWSLVKSFIGHQQKITSVSITDNLEYMISTAIDKEFVVWKQMK